MVVWLFAGGGEAEVRGLIPFLEKQYSCTFQRKTPIRRKPGPKPNKQGYGATGRSLSQQIKQQLEQYGANCDLILVIDDLDCKDEKEQREKFLTAINSVAEAQHLKRFIAFAAPEIEAWLIADWDNTIVTHVDFRGGAQAMRRELSQEYNVPFDAPEAFSRYDAQRDTCQDKLSDALIQVIAHHGHQFYSKGSHTPLLLQKIKPQIVSQKCPLFRKMHAYLSDYCNPN